MTSGTRLVRQLEDRVRHFARQERLWSEGGRLVLAVSGGGDSLCMLHIMARLAALDGLDLIVAHLHHGMRGGEADEDCRFVRSQAGALGLPFRSDHADVPALARALGAGLEEAGRRARRRFLDGVLADTAADAAATAHTRSDHVETVLLHLFRGAALRGLTGIPPLGYDRRIRPLLCLTRAETLACCKELGVIPRQDPANDDLQFQRNRIRKVVLPLLREEVNPSVDDALVRMSAAARDSLELIEMVGVEIHRAACTSQEGALDRSVLQTAPRAGAAEAIRVALVRLRGTSDGITAAEIDRVLNSLDRGGVTPLSGNYQAECSGSLVRFTSESQASVNRTEEVHELNIPGLVHLPGARIGARLASVSEQPGEADEWLLRVCIAFRPPIRVRTWQAGDRIQPLGHKRSRKLKEIFQEQRIPTWKRSVWPLALDADGPLWAPGLALDNRSGIFHPAKVLARLECRFEDDLAG